MLIVAGVVPHEAIYNHTLSAYSRMQSSCCQGVVELACNAVDQVACNARCAQSFWPTIFCLARGTCHYSSLLCV